ncbi:hypothetical protein FACS189414_0100 [Bacteroidia bacterium]|nr:hypothetical protein FACS189414_0100 [Bacteroidia bacterium]
MKDWRDFFYFSKGERRALTLLLFLVTISGILLVISDRQEEKVDVTTDGQYIVNPDNAPVAMEIDTTQALTPLSKTQTSSKKKKTAPPRTFQKPRPSFPKAEKFPVGTVVELNTADTTTLKKVPGIGTTFAKRIVKYRALLGGYYAVEQLQELYGMDEERYQALQSWFIADTAFIAKLSVNYLPSDSLAKHPYLNYRQARSIYQLRKQKGQLTGWENLELLDEFSATDRERLSAYLSFYYKK